MLAADAPAEGVARACALHPGLSRLAVGSGDRRNERFSDDRVAIGIPAAQTTMNARTKQAATGRSAGALARLTHPDRIVFEHAGYPQVDVPDSSPREPQLRLQQLAGRQLPLLCGPAYTTSNDSMQHTQENT